MIHEIFMREYFFQKIGNMFITRRDRFYSVANYLVDVSFFYIINKKYYFKVDLYQSDNEN